jgi:hypothetical protein
MGYAQLGRWYAHRQQQKTEYNTEE